MKRPRIKIEKRVVVKEKSRKVLYILIVIFVEVVIVSYFSNDKIEKRKSIEFLNSAEPPFIKNGQLTFIAKNSIDTIKGIDIEVSDNDSKRTQGMMWRRSMSDSIGMLFMFEKESRLNFWMKNTYIPLDIIFINRSLEIVAIRTNAAILNEKSISSIKPAQYVVEVIAGFCNNHKIRNGDKIKFNIIKQ